MIASAESPRVLVILGNLALNGQERGNVQVFTSLRSVGVASKFVTHSDWGHLNLQPYLDLLEHEWEAIAYARHFTKRLRARDWVTNVRRLLKASSEFNRIVRSYRPSHIHVANPHYFLSVLPALMRTRIPIIYRLGDEPTLHHPLYRVLWRRFIVPKVTRMVCVSEFVRFSAIRSGVPPEKLDVIRSLPPQRPPPREPLALAPFEGRTVAFVGQMTPQKGLGVLIRAAITLCHRRADFRLVLAGRVDATNRYVMDLAAEILNAGLNDRIRFLGYVEDVPGLFAASDLHVAPSIYEEPLANTVLEAKQAGVPSIVFQSGGLPEVVRDGHDGTIVSDKSPEALASAIESYLEMPEPILAEKKTAAGESLTHLGITPEQFTAAWAKVYGVGQPN